MHALWAGAVGRPLVTVEGESVHVLYPGIPAGNYGPDYRDAVVSFGHAPPVRGDVELHLRSDDWRRHGHEGDAAYGRLILHVVGGQGKASPIRIDGGRSVPEIVLPAQAGGWRRSGLPCAWRARQDEAVVRIVLSQAGLARTIGRASELAARVEKSDLTAMLAVRVARALGYAANAAPAMELGKRLAACGLLTSLPCADAGYRGALTVGLAGLLPSQRMAAGMGAGRVAQRWEAWWRGLSSALAPMESQEWRLTGLYPNNHPVRRMAALAALWPDIRGIAATAVALMQERGCGAPECSRLLERLFRRPGDDYWRCHYDFGLVTRESDVIGGSKAREIVVNALLPWLATAMLRSRDSKGLDTVLQLMAAYPAASPNAVTRHMRRQLGLPRSAATASEQQGMLQLFREFCRRGRCAECPLGGRWAQSRHRVAVAKTAALTDSALC